MTKNKLYARIAIELIPLAVVAWGCVKLAALPALVSAGISPLTLAIVVGIVLGNIVPPRHVMHLIEGVQFSKAKLLRLGIILYGFRITLTQVAHAGWPALLTDVAVVCTTFWLAMMLGKRFKMDNHTSALVGAGSAICGAAAVLAAQPVLNAKEHDTGVAVATVVVFGTVAMFVYPLMAAALLPHDASASAWFGWGLYTGGTVHEVAQVAAAGTAVNPVVADIAVITKMIRVMLLAPFLLVLPWVMKHFNKANEEAHGGVVIPWFAFGFLAMVGVNSVWTNMSPAVHQAILAFDTFLLTVAMFALGLTTRWQSVRQAGIKPLLMAGILAVWLLIGGAAISYAAYELFQ
ncbi:MAG: YeiH family protein [Neisseria sp.]|uniref:YeiH family protein n=1 Tax=Neisseria sp. TaxID=192066 RepID=UPI0026DCF74E|nr:YeiH family protein [Neisseria sp.]MDO4640660.1 YeiH family protein [Neisseria sp.]